MHADKIGQRGFDLGPFRSAVQPMQLSGRLAVTGEKIGIVVNVPRHAALHADERQATFKRDSRADRAKSFDYGTLTGGMDAVGRGMNPSWCRPRAAKIIEKATRMIRSPRIPKSYSEESTVIVKWLTAGPRSVLRQIGANVLTLYRISFVRPGKRRAAPLSFPAGSLKRNIRCFRRKTASGPAITLKKCVL